MPIVDASTSRAGFMVGLPHPTTADPVCGLAIWKSDMIEEGVDVAGDTASAVKFALRMGERVPSKLPPICGSLSLASMADANC